MVGPIDLPCLHYNIPKILNQLNHMVLYSVQQVTTFYYLNQILPVPLEGAVQGIVTTDLSPLEACVTEPCNNRHLS